MHIPTLENLRLHRLKEIDITIAYKDIGNGNQTLLFIHGLGNSLIGWEMNSKILSESYRCISIDLPGNGLSSKGDYPYGIDFFAHSIATFIKEKNLTNVTLVGHSMGGQVSMRIAFLYPQLIGKIILIATAGIEEFTSFEKTIMTAGMNFFDLGMTHQNKLRQALVASFYHIDHKAKKVIDDMVHLLEEQTGASYNKMIDQCVQSMLDNPPRTYSSKIEQPFLLIFGDKDAMIPNKIFHPYSTTSLAKKGIQYFQNAELVMIKNAGHFVHWERANEVNDAIRSFL